MYFTFIYPYLVCCIEIWGNTYETHLNPLFKLKKKTITFSYYQDHTGPLFNKLNNLDFLIISHTKSRYIFRIIPDLEYFRSTRGGVS